MTESSAKKRYSLWVFSTGLIFGFAFFPGLVYLYDWAGVSQDLAHGAALILAFILNFLLGLLMIIIGRVVIGWKPMQL